MKRRLFIAIILIFSGECIYSRVCNAQTADLLPVPPVVLPPSPEVSSFASYGIIPVSYYTGKANIEIPVFNLVSGSINVPVSISYNYSGNKVDDVASWVGLGWNLNCGGVISRTIKGLPDEGPSGLFSGEAFETNGNPFLPNCFNPGGPDYSEYYHELSTGEIDGRPDQFYYNFMGKSGKFVFSHDKTLLLAAREKIEISHPFNSFPHNPWIVKDEKGVTYFFGRFMDQTALDYSINDPSCGYPSPIPPPVSQEGITSWHLIAIVSTDKTDTVFFEYEPYTMIYEISGQSSKSYLISGQAVGAHTQIKLCQKNTITHNGARLKKIYSSQGSIEFVAGNQTRCDVRPANPAINNLRPLSGILVKDAYGSIIKEFALEHSYFGNIANCSNPANGKFLRLKLESITEVGTESKKHTFSYHETPVAPRVSPDQDHWGYANGASNADLIPTVIVEGTTYSGANRNPSFTHCRGGALKEIEYPTGGLTTFEYELNDYHGKDESHEYGVRFENLSSVYVNTFNNYPVPVSTDSDSFFLSEQSDVKIQCDFNCTTPGGFIGCGYVELKYPDGSIQTFTDCPVNDELTLSPGNYEIIAKIPAGEAEIDFRVRKKIIEEVPMVERIKIPGPGIRIKRITSSDGISSPIVREYTYTIEGHGDSVSSGAKFRPLKYYEIISKTQGIPGDMCITTHEGGYLHISDRSHARLGYDVSAEIGYSRVAEHLGVGGSQGKIVYIFSNSATYEHRNPLLRKKITYNGLGEVIEYLQNTYTFLAGANDPIEVLGFSVVPDSYSNCYDCTKTQYIPDIYNVLSEWYFLSSAKHVKYVGEGADSIVQLTNYNYDNPVHMQPTRIGITRSDGKNEVTYVTYPLDYSNSSGFLKDMKDEHLVDYSIEQVKVREEGGSKAILSGVITKYKTGAHARLDETLQLEISSPLSSSSFKFSNRGSAGTLPPSGSASVFSPDSRYKLRDVFDDYDLFGNILQYRINDGSPVCYLWDYGGQYPVAQVRNASQGNIAYTSFEGDGKGNWSYSGTIQTSATNALTGKKYYAISGLMSKGGLTSSETYLLSYWQKGGSVTVNAGAGTVGAAVTGPAHNGWTYIQRKISGATTVTLSGSGYVDQVRLHPLEAQMTTYTYDPLIGMTSQTDASGKVTYYEYDGFQRLKAVRKLDGELLESYDYHYKDQ